MSHEFYASPNLSQQEWEPILLSKSSWVPKLALDLRFQLLLLDVSQVICPLEKVALRKVRLEDVKMRQGRAWERSTEPGHHCALFPRTPDSSPLPPLASPCLPLPPLPPPAYPFLPLCTSLMSQRISSKTISPELQKTTLCEDETTVDVVWKGALHST